MSLGVTDSSYVPRKLKSTFHHMQHAIQELETALGVIRLSVPVPLRKLSAIENALAQRPLGANDFQGWVPD